MISRTLNLATMMRGVLLLTEAEEGSEEIEVATTQGLILQATIKEATLMHPTERIAIQEEAIEGTTLTADIRLQ